MAQQGIARMVAAERVAVKGEREAGRRTRMAQAGAQGMGRSERAAISGRRQTETREGAAGEGSEHEGEGRSDASRAQMSRRGARDGTLARGAVGPGTLG